MTDYPLNSTYFGCILTKNIYAIKQEKRTKLKFNTVIYPNLSKNVVKDN